MQIPEHASPEILSEATSVPASRQPRPSSSRGQWRRGGGLLCLRLLLALDDDVVADDRGLGSDRSGLQALSEGLKPLQLNLLLLGQTVINNKIDTYCHTDTLSYICKS